MQRRLPDEKKNTESYGSADDKYENSAQAYDDYDEDYDLDQKLDDLLDFEDIDGEETDYAEETAENPEYDEDDEDAGLWEDLKYDEDEDPDDDEESEPWEDEDSEDDGDSDAEPEGKQLTEEELEELEQKLFKKEIRQVLLGNFVVYEDGSYGAGNGSWVSAFGFNDGALRTIYYGISRKQYPYTSVVKNNTKILFDVLRAMKKIGRRLIFVTESEYPACYIKSYIFRPVVLLFVPVSNDKHNTRFMLRAYCSRGLLSFLSIRRAVSRFDKEIPSQLSRGGRNESSRKKSNRTNENS